jgi:hypothetical protein
VRLNDCYRREKTFPTMSYFQFNGALDEHPGPEGFVTRPRTTPIWTASLTAPAEGPRIAGRDGARTHINRGRTTVGLARIF